MKTMDNLEPQPSSNPNDLVTKLYSLKNGGEEDAFFNKLEADLSDRQIVEFLFRVLERLGTNDYGIAYRCYKLLETHANFSDLERIKSIAARLPAIKGLRDYRDDFKIKLPIILTNKAKNKCACETKATNSEYIDKAYFNIDQQYVEDYVGIYLLTCLNCQRRWKVEEDISYHYPTYRWTSFE